MIDWYQALSDPTQAFLLIWFLGTLITGLVTWGVIGEDIYPNWMYWWKGYKEIYLVLWFPFTMTGMTVTITAIILILGAVGILGYGLWELALWTYSSIYEIGCTLLK